MHFSQHNLYFKKKGSNISFPLCSGSLYKCRTELFEYLCMHANCLYKVKSWRFLKKFCEKYDIPLSISPMHDYATFENWIYFID